jgi:tRNA pseudouridine38-40 synthase
MDKNFKIIIEYDGTSFFGWQKQPNQKTVQEEIEKALSRILNQNIKIRASGRTDSGVHALGQVASFKANTNLDTLNVKKGLNSLIKQPIVIRDCSVVDDSFHAQYNAVSKEYHYHILNREDPSAVGRLYQWHIRKPLDVKLMQQCCNQVAGIHDFKSFESTGSPRSSTIREIFFFNIENQDHNKIVFKICGSGFLKYMVRNLVGTIVLAGTGKISVEDFKKIIKTKDRSKAGATAPALGLFLKKVNYS